MYDQNTGMAFSWRSAARPLAEMKALKVIGTKIICDSLQLLTSQLGAFLRTHPNIGVSILSSELSPHDDKSSSIECHIPSFHIELVPILHLDVVRQWFTETLPNVSTPLGIDQGLPVQQSIVLTTTLWGCKRSYHRFWYIKLHLEIGEQQGPAQLFLTISICGSYNLPSK